MQAPTMSIDRVSVPSPSVAEALIELCAGLGVREAYGLVGGAIAPLCDALGKSTLACYQLRHEAGAMFAACEASLATDRPVLVFVTTGPGLTNAITGAVAARWEGARVIVVSGATSAAQRGRWAVQETTSETLPASGIASSGPIFDYATTVEHPGQLPAIAQRLAHGLAAPGGFVAHLSLPINVQRLPMPRIAAPRATAQHPTVTDEIIDDIVAKIAEGPLAIWVGYGARHAADEIAALAERTGARLMCTPRGKGIVSERHPRFIGVTGCGGHESVEKALAAEPPLHTLVLGSRLGEFSSCWSPGLEPTGAFIHVDVDAEVFGAAYPHVPTVGVVADVATLLRALVERVDARPSASGLSPRLRSTLSPRDAGPVRPQLLMAAIQDRIVDGSDAIVMAESGNSFAWTNHELAFETPGRYRVSGLWGSMGHATSGVVGAALGRDVKAVAVVGDGAMLMMNEVSAAVQYDAKAVWIVLNDAVMGIVDRGMRALGMTPFQTLLPPTDFAAIANALGAEGIRVDSEHELAAALDRAMTSSRPVVVDVVIDASIAAPIARRFSTLTAMSATKP